MYLNALEQLGIIARAVNQHVPSLSDQQVGDRAIGGLTGVSTVEGVAGAFDGQREAVCSCPELCRAPIRTVDGIPADALTFSRPAISASFDTQMPLWKIWWTAMILCCRTYSYTASVHLDPQQC